MQANKHSATGTGRLYFLDWVRIVAFFLLILYHVGMYYVSWDWHVKSPHAGSAIEPLMLLSSPWRLGLLFLVSGVASAFMLEKLRALAFVRQRSARLLLPLVFGMFVIVPPQAYLEVVEKVAYAGSYGDFMALYLRAYDGFCRGTDCLDLPTWNHLWFVAYLWTYTLLLAAIAAALGPRMARCSAALARLLTGWKLIVLPLAVLAVARMLLLTRFPSTHGLTDDWYNHANYFTLFLLGALLAGQAPFWREVAAQRFVALGTALACWAALVVYFSLPEQLVAHDRIPDAVRMAQRAVFALCQWSAIVAVCGFGHRHLQFDSAKRRYLTQAVFPVYIVHQTLIVVFAHALKPVGLAPVTEALVLVVGTVTASFGCFEAVRRIPLLRACFGIAKAGVPPAAATSRTSAYGRQDRAAAASACR